MRSIDHIPISLRPALRALYRLVSQKVPYNVLLIHFGSMLSQYFQLGDPKSGNWSMSLPATESVIYSVVVCCQIDLDVIFLFQMVSVH